MALSPKILFSCEDYPLTSHQSLLTLQFWLRLRRAVAYATHASPVRPNPGEIVLDRSSEPINLGTLSL
jgi:hypothetical protein